MNMIQFLARRRVFLGFVTAVAAAILSQPTWASWRRGLAIAIVGEIIRVWAAGHLEKSQEVTRSGPYRWTRHPLYVGSSVIAAGVVVASRSPVVAALTVVYMGATLTAAVRTEEAFLRRAFGETYDQYSRSSAPAMHRPFSIERAIRNREYRAVVGVLAGFAFLALRIVLSI